MKKRILILMMAVSLLSSMYAGATSLKVKTKTEVEAESTVGVECEADTEKDVAVEEPASEENGFAIVINGNTEDFSTSVFDETHYVPLRTVFEKAGARVYFRNRDRQILILTRWNQHDQRERYGEEFFEAIRFGTVHDLSAG